METKIIFGAPGTGKTTKLLSILEELLENYHPKDIAYVSFTKEGAYQGKHRAIEKFNIYTEKDFTYFATLHSIAFRALKLKRMDILQKKHYKLFSNQIGMNFTGYYTEEFYNNDDKYLFFNEVYRNNSACARMYIDTLDINKVEYVNKNYKKFKETYNLMDFTDIIEKFNNNKIKIPVKIVIIDEAQDLTTLQWKMIWTAFKDCEKMYIAGDDDQAIYQWSGADVEYFLSIKGEIEILKHSYRLPKNILYLSKNIAERITKRVNKNIDGKEEIGVVDMITSLDEIKINKNETYLFLSRNNSFLKELNTYLKHKGLLFYNKYEPSAIQKDYDLIKLFEEIRKTKIIEPKNEYKLKPILKQNINLDLPWYSNFNWEIEKIDYFREIIGNKNLNFSSIKIKISTIHTAKGAEADNVILITDITKNVYENLDKNPDSEHRVFYVGCTRAKNNLYILQGGSKYEYKIF